MISAKSLNRSFVSPPAIRRTSIVHLSSRNFTLNHCHNPRISLPIRSYYPRISLSVAELQSTSILLVSFLISFDSSDFLVNFLIFFNFVISYFSSAISVLCKWVSLSGFAVFCSYSAVLLYILKVKFIYFNLGIERIRTLLK